MTDPEPVTETPARRPGRWRWIVGTGALALLALIGWLAWYPWSGVPHREVPATPEPLASPSAPAPDAAERLKAAMAAAFPEGPSADVEGSKVDYADGKIVDAPFGPVLVSEGQVADAAHADPGYVAIHYLAADGAGFRLTGAYPQAIVLGSSGTLTEWAVSDKFGSLPVVSASGGGSWQGYSCGSTVLEELRPDGPVQLVSFQDTYDDSGAVADGAVTLKGVITDIVPDTSFTVKFTGTRTFEDHYVRRGNRYEREGGPSELPEC
jgi:hypothetical protein